MAWQGNLLTLHFDARKQRVLSTKGEYVSKLKA